MVDRVDPRLIGAQVAHATKKLEMGWMGMIFGDATEKPGNVAAIAIVLAFVGLMIVLFAVPDSATTPKGQVVTLLGSIITGALGFLFGRKT